MLGLKDKCYAYVIGFCVKMKDTLLHLKHRKCDTWPTVKPNLCHSNVLIKIGWRWY